MKKGVFFLFIICGMVGRGQKVVVNSTAPTCLVNGDFSNWNGSTIEDPCIQTPTFNQGAVYNWVRSHGTPQIHHKSGSPSFNYMYMNDNHRYSEGIYAGYNFVAGNHYDIEVEIQFDVPEPGKVMMYAANGIVQGNMNDCQYPLIEVPDKQFIGSFDEATGTYDQLSFLNANGDFKTFKISNFVPTANYSQFWIYPRLTNPPVHEGVQLNIKKVNICDGVICDYNVVSYNNGNIPAGTTEAGYINAGSTAGSGGSGTVTVALAATTELVANQQINLLPSLQATVTSGTFIARINPCDNSNALATGNSSILQLVSSQQPVPSSAGLPNHSITSVDSLLALSSTGLSQKTGGLKIYPTITRDILWVSSEKTGDEALLSIYKIDGSHQKYIVLQPLQRLQNVDVSSLANGMYILQIYQRQNSQTFKFQVMR